jgi:hypothetical protein
MKTHQLDLVAGESRMVQIGDMHGFAAMHFIRWIAGPLKRGVLKVL